MLSCLSLCLVLTQPAPVTALAYQPFGTVLAAGSDRSVTFIDPAKGEVTGRIDIPGPVTALAFTPDGAILAVATGKPGRLGEVRLYQLPAISPPRVIAAHADLVYGLAVSGDGKQLATGGYDKLVKLWDIATGRELFTLKDHSDAVYAVAFQPGGKLLASAAADRAVKVWDTATGKRLYSLTDSTDWLHAVAVSPDGRLLAAAGIDKSIRVWELGATEGTLRRAFFAHDGPVLRLAISPDGTTLYSLGEDRRLKAWDPATGTERRSFDPLPELAQSVAVSPDGKQLAVGRHDGAVTLHDAATGKVQHQPLPEKPKPPRVTSLNPRFAPAGRPLRLTIAGERLDAVTTVSSANNEVAVRLITERRSPTQIALDVTLPASLPPSPLTLTFRSPAGDATTALMIDRFDVADDGRLDATYAGQLDRAGAEAVHSFELVAGQEVGAQVTLPPGAKLEPALQWRGADGRPLVAGGGTIAFVTPTAGRFTLAVRDREYRGGPEYGYRLYVGRIPVVTGVEPLGLRQGTGREFRLIGVHLPFKAVRISAPADAKPGSRIPVPVTSPHGAVAGSPQVVVGESPEADSGEIPVPGTANGRLVAPGGRETWTFVARRGQPLVIETHARRLGSPVDTTVDVLDAQGRPVEQARLRCVAKTAVVLRETGATDRILRMEAWNEFALDDFMLLGNEVIRIADLPGHPDADTDLYEIAGRRQTYFGTTAGFHALGAPLYRVQVLPAGTPVSSNGFPTVPLYYRNDDGGPGFDKDSCVLFDPPDDGTYRVTVTDARGEGGENYLYRLTVRPPRPGFNLKLSAKDPGVTRGQAVVIGVTAERIDGFDGPIAVGADRLPAGFSSPPTVIETGQTRASLTLTAATDAPEPKVPLTVTGRAAIGTAAAKLGRPKLIDAGEIITHVKQPEVVIRPGHESHLEVRIERRGGFTGRVPLEVKGLPHGVRVLHLGLNGIMITEKETTRRITLYAEPWVAPTERPVAVVAKHEVKKTDHAAPPVPLRVVK